MNGHVAHRMTDSRLQPDFVIQSVIQINQKG